MQDIPIKVDLVHGSDGLELLEVIQSLRFRADHLQVTQPFQSDFLKTIANKYERLYMQRQEKLKNTLLHRYCSK